MSAIPPTFAERLVAVETEARAVHEFRADVESRLRRLETALYLGMGALGVLQLALKFWKP